MRIYADVTTHEDLPSVTGETMRMLPHTRETRINTSGCEYMQVCEMMRSTIATGATREVHEV